MLSTSLPMALVWPRHATKSLSIIIRRHFASRYVVVIAIAIAIAIAICLCSATVSPWSTFNRRVRFTFSRLFLRSSRDIICFENHQCSNTSECDCSIHDHPLISIAFASQMIAFFTTIAFYSKEFFCTLLPYSKVNTVLIHFTGSKILIATTSWLFYSTV